MQLKQQTVKILARCPLLHYGHHCGCRLAPMIIAGANAGSEDAGLCPAEDAGLCRRLVFLIRWVKAQFLQQRAGAAQRVIHRPRLILASYSQEQLVIPRRKTKVKRPF